MSGELQVVSSLMIDSGRRLHLVLIEAGRRDLLDEIVQQLEAAPDSQSAAELLRGLRGS